MNNDCGAIPCPDSSTKIADLAREITKLAIGVKNEMDDLYIYFNGPKPNDKQLDDLERNLNYIRNNILDIQEAIRHTR